MFSGWRLLVTVQSDGTCSSSALFNRRLSSLQKCHETMECRSSYSIHTSGASRIKEDGNLSSSEQNVWALYPCKTSPVAVVSYVSSRAVQYSLLSAWELYALAPKCFSHCTLSKLNAVSFRRLIWSCRLSSAFSRNRGLTVGWQVFIFSVYTVPLCTCTK